MTISELMDIAPKSKWLDEDGERITVTFEPRLDEAAILAIEQQLAAQLPVDLREAMKICSGIGGLGPEIDFTARFFGVGTYPGLNRAFGFAHDGFGNYWYADVLSKQEQSARIYFLCHDPAYLEYAYPSLDAFLEDAVACAKDPDKGMGEATPTDGAEVEPITYSDALNGDTVLRTFAQGLDDRHVFLDLRKSTSYATIDLMEIDRKSDLQRHAEERLFAYVPKVKGKGFFARLFGG